MQFETLFVVEGVIKGAAKYVVRVVLFRFM
jgi:hypothetical protein